MSETASTTFMVTPGHWQWCYWYITYDILSFY